MIEAFAACPPDILVMHLPNGADGCVTAPETAEHAPKIVIVLTGENLPAPALGPLVAHHAAFRASLTLAAMPVPAQFGRFFRVIDMAPNGRVRSIADAPDLPSPMPHDASHALVMLGAAICDRDWLVRVAQTGLTWRIALDNAVAEGGVRACAQPPLVPAAWAAADRLNFYDLSMEPRADPSR